MIKKQIFLQVGSQNKMFSEFFDYNNILYNKIDIYNTDLDGHGRYDIPQQFEVDNDIIFVIEFDHLYALTTWPQSQQNLVNFLKRGNRLIVSQDMDSVQRFNVYQTQIHDLDRCVPPGSIMYVIDAGLPATHHGFALTNGYVRITPYNSFMTMPRLHCGGYEKNTGAKDFLVTTVVKKLAPHRNKLYQQLEQRNLLDRGLCVFHRSEPNWDDWQGWKPANCEWRAFYCSQDLYTNAYMEIVPETLYKNGYYFTEKTCKPIAAKTPFFAVTSMGYLQFLRNKLGFSTLGNLISEKYDLEPRIEDRIRLMLDQLEDIIRNGTESFYRACELVLEHNQRRLAEITGSFVIATDQFLAQCLQEVDQ